MQGIIHPDGKDVFLFPINEKRRQFMTEGAVTICPFAQIITVDPYLAVTVNAVEINIEKFIFFRSVKGEAFPVPANACRKCTSGGTGRVRFGEFTFNAPVGGE